MVIFMKRFSLVLWAPMIALWLAACDGGGGGAGTPAFGPGSGGGGGGGGTVTYAVALALSSQTVTAAQPATVTARVTTSTGAPVASQVVSFNTGAGLGTFSSSSALTDADGVATVILS